MSYAAEVIADHSEQWVSNSLRFATEEEALAYVRDLQQRWLQVTNTRIVESDDPVNYAIIDHTLTKVDATD